MLVAACSWIRAHETALPICFLLLVLSAGAQLPSYIFLAHFLDGNTAVTLQVIDVYDYSIYNSHPGTTPCKALPWQQCGSRQETL